MAIMIIFRMIERSLRRTDNGIESIFRIEWCIFISGLQIIVKSFEKYSSTFEEIFQKCINNL